VSTAAGAAIAAVFGAVLGSFLNVVIWRLPRGENLATPPSACPSCGKAIKPYDNIPVLSWLLLRGKCRNCGARISARYPLVEALTAALLAAVVVRYGADEDAVLGLVFVLILVPLTFIDIDHRILPNKITYPAAVVAPVLVLLTRPDDIAEHLIAGAAAFFFLFAAAWFYPKGMGVGDVKLAGVMGLFLGRTVAPGMLIAFLAGSLVGLAIMARKGVAEGRKTAVPFGPFLAFGGLVALFAGEEIVDWYLDTFASGA
jgi:leader peptidase (prepilin peptidase) / N-methyltransferase